jgi:hypothetical protein
MNLKKLLIYTDTMICDKEKQTNQINHMSTVAERVPYLLIQFY